MCDAAATAAASRAAQQEEDLQASASGAVELDEFGRDANMMKRQEAAERRQRRMQRLQQQADKQTGSQVCILMHTTQPSRSLSLCGTASCGAVVYAVAGCQADSQPSGRCD